MSLHLDFSCSSNATAKGQDLKTAPVILLLYLDSDFRTHSDVLHSALAHAPFTAGYAGLNKALYMTRDAARKGSEKMSGYETHAFSRCMEQMQSVQQIVNATSGN